MKKFKYEGWSFSPHTGAMPPGFKGWRTVPVVRDSPWGAFSDIDFIPEWGDEAYEEEEG